MRLIVLTLSLLLLAACGQKGNLYLPGEPAPGRQFGRPVMHTTTPAAPESSAAAAANNAAPMEPTAAPSEPSAAPASPSPVGGGTAPAQP